MVNWTFCPTDFSHISTALGSVIETATDPEFLDASATLSTSVLSPNDPPFVASPISAITVGVPIASASSKAIATGFAVTDRNSLRKAHAWSINS
ncbi:unannotated protein [freshwater metagenome]|uniref:Unannotated protein n=1 Tax=freshwater metagenome TaxID=449393 RepID=A0A6J6G1V2_9ZZZZ